MSSVPERPDGERPDPLDGVTDAELDRLADAMIDLLLSPPWYQAQPAESHPEQDLTAASVLPERLIRRARSRLARRLAAEAES